MQFRKRIQKFLIKKFRKKKFHHRFGKKDFKYPNRTIRIGTCFSGIGAIEHAFQRLKLNHKIVFAGDIDENCRKSYLANYAISEKDWFSDIRNFDAKKYKHKIDFLVGGAPC